MITKREIQKHVIDLISKTGFKKFHIAKLLGISPPQLSHVINGHRIKAEHREAIFCFLKHHLSEINNYEDVWLEDRPGTIHFKDAA